MYLNVYDFIRECLRVKNKFAAAIINFYRVHKLSAYTTTVRVQLHDQSSSLHCHFSHFYINFQFPKLCSTHNMSWIHSSLNL